MAYRYETCLVVAPAFDTKFLGDSYEKMCIRDRYMDNNEVPTNLAWAYVMQAERQLSHLDSARTRIAIEKQIPTLIQSKISEQNSKAGKAAHANSPEYAEKQKIRKEVEQQFKDSSYPFHKRGYTAKFVNEMVARYPKIKSQKTIEKWVAEFKKKK